MATSIRPAPATKAINSPDKHSFANRYFEKQIAPLSIFDEKRSLGSLIAQAIENRPERKQNEAAIAGARATKKGATVGPLIPTLGAQAFIGGLGGDSSAGRSRFDDQQDYFVGVSWRIGQGGLFDVGRTRAAESQLKAAELSGEKLNDKISHQVVDAFVRVQSLRDQVDSAKRVLKTAEDGLRLANYEENLPSELFWKTSRLNGI